MAVESLVRRTAAVVIAAGLALGACASDGTGTGTDASGSTLPGGTGQTADTILDVAAPVVGGGEIDLASYEGKALALWFWAPT